MPFELRPYPTETLKPEGEYLQRTWKNSVYPMAEKMGVKIVLPKVSPQPYTHLAFEGYQFAKEKGLGTEYNHRMFTAFFQDQLDIGNIEVLTQIAEEMSLDKEAFHEALTKRSFKALHQGALKHSYEDAKITAVPTFIIGERRLQGIHPLHTLESVIDDQLQLKEKE